MTTASKLLAIILATMFFIVNSDRLYAQELEPAKQSAKSETKKAAQQKKSQKRKETSAEADKSKEVGSAKDNAEKSTGTWERTKTAVQWIAIGTVVIVVLSTLQYSFGMAIIFGLAGGTLSYIIKNDFAAWGRPGIVVGVVIGVLLGIYEWATTRKQSRGAYVTSVPNNQNAVIHPEINPTTGLPMHGAVDSMGNSYSAPGVNPASGLPMAGGIDVGGNVYGTNNHT